MSEQSTEQNMDNLNQAIAGTNDTATEKEFWIIFVKILMQ